MNKKTKHILKHLSHSILLKETGGPVLLRLVILFILTLLGVFIYWSSQINLNQVITAKGEIFTKDTVVKLQHEYGGTIKNIYFSEGDLVNSGDKLLDFTENLLNLKTREVKAEIYNQNRQIKLIEEELNIKKNLLDQELISRSSYISLERTYFSYLQNRTTNYFDLEKLNYRLKSLFISSPIKGYIHYYKNLTEQSIIRPGEVVYEIIPFKRNFIAEVLLSANDRGKIYIGQNCTLKVNSYDYEEFGGLSGTIDEISIKTYSYNVGTYYKVKVQIDRDYIGSPSNKKDLIPGMLLTCEIKTGSVSLLEYLILPVKAMRNNSFNEE